MPTGLATSAQAKIVTGYMRDCISVANSHFTTLVVVQPGIALIEEDGKAPANIAYMEHISALVMGVVVSDTILSSHYYIPREVTNLAARVRVLKKVTKRTLEKHQMFIHESSEAGYPVIFH